MVKHVIMWKLKEEFNTAYVKEGMKKNLEALMGKIPGLIELSVQVEKLPSSNADVMLYSVFEDHDALKGYTVHPDHVHAADNFVRPFTATRMCMDFEV